MLTSDQLDRTFAALADPTRRSILARLTRGETSVKELALQDYRAGGDEAPQGA
jgi:DNA-binding transcriptional ArsR family regulator